MAVHIDCLCELAGELFRFETMRGGIGVVSYAEQDVHHLYHGGYQFHRAKILLLSLIF